MVKRTLRSLKKITTPKEGSASQLELNISREREDDRNLHLGGRSFYFFDFDDNVAFLSTPLIIFHKETKEELVLTSGEFASHHAKIGNAGPYKDYYIDFCDATGTFRHFRDKKMGFFDRLIGQKQLFVEDLLKALKDPDYYWQGPSWSCFYHATLNERPLSIITARGHHPETIKEGIRWFVKKGFIEAEPNYLCVLPVSHPDIKAQLGDPEGKLSTAELKKRAIRASVEKAIEVYGNNPHHRFGMSDDDKKNIELILEEMESLKKDYPEMSFFIIETHEDNYFKREVFLDHCEYHQVTEDEQLTLF